MGTQTTSNLTNSIIARYVAKYLDAIKQLRLYDQIAMPYTDVTPGMTMAEIMKSSAIYIPYLSVMTPGVTAIPQTGDLTAQTLTDALTHMTTTSRGEALQWTQQLSIQTYTDYTAKAYERLGQNFQESIELLAIEAALQGSWLERAVAARASLDAGTAGHRASDAIFRKMDGLMQSLRVPGYLDVNSEPVWTSIMHPFVFHDIAESGNVNDIGLYQDAGIHLNWELGKIGRFRLLSSAFAKVFMGAGAANATPCETTLASAVDALSTSIVTAADNAAQIDNGLTWMVGTIESGNTFYPTNEKVKPLSAVTVTVEVNGEGENGGMRYAHLLGETVSNRDSVYTVLFAGPQSLVKAYAVDPGNGDPDAQAIAGGEGGAIVGPLFSGLAHQYNTLAWKYFGGYARITENRVVRQEVSTSYDNV